MTARQTAKMIDEYRDDLDSRASTIERLFGPGCPIALAYRDAIRLAWDVLQQPFENIANEEEAKTDV